MLHRFVIGPSAKELRPMKPVDPAKGFPQFDRLEDILSGNPVQDPLTGEDFNRGEVARYVCAVLSQWVYSDLETVATIMTRLGLDQSRCRSIDISNNAALIRSTAYLILSKNRKVALLAYRGTDPFDLSTWAVSGDVNPSMVASPAQQSGSGVLASVRHLFHSGDGRVHSGFYRNQRATWFDIVGALQRALDPNDGDIFRKGERPKVEIITYSDDGLTREEAFPPEVVGTLEHLYVTGHSLGGAMALITGFRIATEAIYADFNRVMQHVYAFAPPRVGDKQFAKCFEERQAHPDTGEDRISCFVYKQDVVPRLPPKLGNGDIDFTHVGKFFWVKSENEASADSYNWPKDSTEPPAQADSAGQFLLAFSAAFGEQLDLGNAIASVLRWIPRLVAKFWACVLTKSRLFTLYDHFPQHYVAVSALPNRKQFTELGGDF